MKKKGEKRWNTALYNQRKECMGEGQKANLVAQGLLLFDMIDGKKMGFHETRVKKVRTSIFKETKGL